MAFLMLEAKLLIKDPVLEQNFKKIRECSGKKFKIRGLSWIFESEKSMAARWHIPRYLTLGSPPPPPRGSQPFQCSGYKQKNTQQILTSRGGSLKLEIGETRTGYP